MDQTRLENRDAYAAPVWRSSFLLTLLVCSLAFAWPSPTSAQCQYEVVVFEGPHCFLSLHAVVYPRGINNHGTVVGFHAQCNFVYFDAFYWTEETGGVSLPRPSGVISAFANDINDHGQIVGTHQFPGIGQKGFVFDIDTGQFTYLEPKHKGVSGQHVVSSANAINNAGVVAGSRVIAKPDDPTPLASNAVIWDTNTGEVIDLGVMNGPHSWASDINEAGHVSGNTGVTSATEGWLWVEGELTMFGPVTGGTTSGGAAINNLTTVATGGHMKTGPDTQAAQWRDGQWEMLPLTADAVGGSALAINDHGQATGRNLYAQSNGPNKGFGALWQHGEVHLLQSLAIDGDLLDDIQLSRDVNNQGQIIARYNGTKAALLKPVNVPLADLNYDCRVDEQDLLLLLQAWGPQPFPRTSSGDAQPHPADLNGDGVVNVFDLLILLENWSPTP